jgi:serine/alanine adding enzyme
MEICELKKEDEEAWDEYVLKHAGSTFYHQIGWKNVIIRTYGHKSFYMVAENFGDIKGILPLFFMKSPIFGNKLISVPFAPYGGAIGESYEIENLLVEKAIEISKDLSADYMELRNNVSKDSKLINNTNYMTMVLKLEKDPELVWKGFNNKVRNAIRKSLNSGLEIKEGGIDDFFSLYSRNMRDLGTPTHSREFFQNIISEFKGNSNIMKVTQNGEALSAAILLYFKDTVISGWAASDRKYNNLNSNNLLYWNAIKTACEKEIKYFDFGRSLANSGTYRFKKPWGAEEKQLQYMYHLNKIKRMPDTSQNNSKRRYVANVWKEFPIFITNNLGPKFRKNFP